MENEVLVRGNLSFEELKKVNEHGVLSAQIFKRWILQETICKCH
jgi:hypothetical protein